MKSLTKFLTFIISFQLLWGCNSQGGGQVVSTKVKTPIPDASESVEINGSIAKVFFNVSNLIIPSANASEGKLSIYDVSIPVDEPVILFSEEISGDATYSLKIKKSLIQSKLLKLKFDSYEGAEKSRDFIIEPGDGDTIIKADMDQDSTIKAKLLEAQLKLEYGSGKLANIKEIKERFREFKNNDVESEIGLLGDKEAVIKLMLDPESSDDIAKILATHRISSSAEKDAIKNELLDFVSGGRKIKLKHELICTGSEGHFEMKGDQEFQVFAVGIQDEVIEKFSDKLDMGAINNSIEADDRMLKLIQILTEIGSQFGKTFSATIYFVSSEEGNEAKYSCELSGLSKDIGNSDLLVMDATILTSVSFKDFKTVDEGVEILRIALDKTIEDLKNQVTNSKLSWEELAKIFEEQVSEAKRLFEERVNLLTQEINGTYVIDPIYLESVTFENVQSEREGQRILYNAYEKTLSALKDQMSARGLSGPEIDKIIEEQVPSAKKLYESRLEEFRFFLGN